MKQKRDIHQEVTDAIIAKIENGTGTWKKSWATGLGGVALRANGKPYKGINQLILMFAGYSNPNWMTYKQASELGGQVRKGEKSTTVVFFKPLKVEDKKTGEEKTVPLLRAYNVFNAEQVDELPARFYPTTDAKHSEPKIAEAEAYLAATGAEIRHGGDRAFFSPQQDFIQLPNFDQFDDASSYYGTAMHELVHWTGHESRLDRNLKTAHGTKDYAREELVAELGAAFLTTGLNIETEVRDDHAEYLAWWLAILKEDKKAIFKAATAAQKAVSFLDDLQSAEELEEAA
jgi:antirestriction protein ArdC